MKRFLRSLRNKARSDCQHCRDLHDGQLRISATELIQGLLCCPACQLLYQSISPSDLSDPRIVLAHVRLSGDSQVSHTFDPKSEAMSRQLRAEEGNRVVGFCNRLEEDRIADCRNDQVSAKEAGSPALHIPLRLPTPRWSVQWNCLVSKVSFAVTQDLSSAGFS